MPHQRAGPARKATRSASAPCCACHRTPGDIGSADTFTARVRHGDLKARIVAGHADQLGATTNWAQDTVGMVGTPGAGVQGHRKTGEVQASLLSLDSALGTSVAWRLRDVPTSEA